MAQRLTLEELETAIKKAMEDYINLHSLCHRSMIIYHSHCGVDNVDFLKVYSKIIEDYLKNNTIKVENSRIFYCNTSIEKNPNKEYQDVSISFPYEFSITYEDYNPKE